jgi:para-nitrobenzyl esterase
VSRVRTESGVVEGLEADGLHHFRNVPFAASPFGANRFLPPQPVEPWDGVRDATKRGVSAPQQDDTTPLAPWIGPQETGEDCLTLEIHTPDVGSTKLPVIVHIHGGAYISGAGSLPAYEGSNFARHGVVYVTINYRLGIEGFLYLGEGHDNLGLRDQTAALAWVQRNIAAFGGDPDRVTIMGQSGGAVSVMANLAMPSSRGLFAQAISMSGCSVPSIDVDGAAKFTRQVAKRLGVAPTVEGMADVSSDRGVKATTSAVGRFALGLVLGDSRSLLISPFQMVRGTESLPFDSLTAAQNGSAASVPLLAGTARNELIDIIAAVRTTAPALSPLLNAGLGRALKLHRAQIEAYRNGPRRIAKRSTLLEAAWTDWAFRIPTIELLEARTPPSWLYEFRWQPETFAPGLGAYHAIDVSFARDDLDMLLALGDAGRERLGANPPRELATQVHEAFVRFAQTGDPGWEPYDTADRQTMIFDTPSTVVPDAAGIEREAWAGKR